MACKTIQGGNSSSYSKKTYLLNQESDLAKLPKAGIRGTISSIPNSDENDPCSCGSTALLVAGGTTEVYILDPDNNWVKM